MTHVVIRVGDALEQLRAMPDGSVHMICTSPPYWSLRDYGHPDQLGLEATPDEYVDKLVAVFREARRVLRHDGTLWLNLGSSYVSDRGENQRNSGRNVGFNERWHGSGKTDKLVKSSESRDAAVKRRANASDFGLKAKDLCAVPWMVGLALQQPYHVGPIKNPTDRAWLAGLVDGDGCLGIRKQRGKEEHHNETYIPYLTVSMTDPIALERCVAITGMGRINVKHRPGDEDHRKIINRRTYYTWRLDGQCASSVIRDIYEFLVIKKVNAQVVYTMNDSLKWGRPTRNIPVPPDIMEKRRYLYTCAKALNQREEIILPELQEVPPSTEPGWWLRSDICWRKTASLPESVEDRPSKSHEYILLLSKSSSYFYDMEAVREATAGADTRQRDRSKSKINGAGLPPGHATHGGLTSNNYATRNQRSVWDLLADDEDLHAAFLSWLDRQTDTTTDLWTFNPVPSSLPHAAMFPPELPMRCILAGTSAHGACSACGAPWKRLIEKGEADVEQQRACGGDANGEYHGSAVKDYASSGAQDASATKARILAGMRVRRTVGWEPTCDHDAPVVPCVVLDPFGGAGTTGLVADRLGRDAVLIEINPANAEIARKRIAEEAPMFTTVEVLQ